MEQKRILPGFVDTHVHLPQFRIMGVGAGDLLTWLNTYTYPEEARFSSPYYAAEVSGEFFRDSLRMHENRCVYSSVHARATHVAFRAAKAIGLRAFIGKVMMDRNFSEALLEDTEESIATACGSAKSGTVRKAADTRDFHTEVCRSRRWNS